MKTALVASVLLFVSLEAQTPATNAAAPTAVAPIGTASAATPAHNPALDLPLFQAAAGGNLDQVKALLNQGANVNVQIGAKHYTPLLVAAGSKHWDIVRYLLSKGADPNLGAITGTHPLTFACEASQWDIAQALLDAGENPNLCDTRFWTPIVYVAREDQIGLMKSFIAHHADVNLTGIDGPPLWHAVGWNRLDMVELLLDSGARIDLEPSILPPARRVAKSDSMVGYAAEYNNIPMIDLLLAHSAPINALGDNGLTGLTEALYDSNSQTVDHLLEKGADPNLPDQYDETPLMLAAVLGKDDEAQANLAALHSHKADLNRANKDGCTPLIFAAMRLRIEGVEFLAEDGADINAKDNHGFTAFQYAADRGDIRVTGYLASEGATKFEPHILPRPQDNPPLPPAKAFALAIGAIFYQVNGDNPHTLADDPYRRAQGTRAYLRHYWDITDPASFRKALDELRNDGDGADYRKTGSQLAQLSDPAFQLLNSADTTHAAEARAVRDTYRKWGDRTGLAYDLCRYVNLVRDGYHAQYIKEDEVWTRILPVARELQAKFSSWKEMADNFRDGRLIWNNGPDERFDNCQKLLLDPNEKESVWNQIPWQTDLGK